MRQAAILLSLALIVIASGCTAFEEQTPKEKFKDLASKSDSSTYRVEYSMSIGETGSLSSIFGNPTVYSHEGETKSVVSTSSVFGTSTTTAVYSFENRSVTCTEGGFLSEEGEVNCRVGGSDSTVSPSTRTDKYEERLQSITVNVTGERKVAGRACEMFVFGNISQEEPFIEGKSNVGICLDKKKGYAALITVNQTQSSELAGETSKNLLKMEANDYSAEVSRKDVEIPVEASLDLQCDPFRAKIYSFKDNGRQELSVNKENQTVIIEEGIHNISLDADLKKSGYNTVKLYTGESAITSECYSYDLEYDESGTSYNTAQTSNLDLNRYELVEGRLENPGFSEYESSNEDLDFDGWTENDGNTHIIGKGDLLEGPGVKTTWDSNAEEVQPASVSQNVNMTGLEAVGIDVAGGQGNPQRAKIILEIDGEKEGEFVTSPQRYETYRDLGVKLDKDYVGTHEITIKWTHVTGDNLGSSLIDNVRVYS